MPFDLQRKQDPKNLQLKADADQASSRDLRALAAGGYDAAAAALAPVQLDGGKAGLNPASVQRAAQAGVAGSGGKMPHLAAIQASFGRHDVGSVQAHAGGNAAAACEDMGASAYASGNAVAFKGAPDLHTAAHEAAHIVQQRGGVSLPGGVGKSGDAYEKHADQVADAVVQGKSAEGLLDAHAGGGAGAAVQQSVQLKGGGGKDKGGVGKDIKSGFKAIGEALPGGAIWDSTLTSNKTQRDDKSTKEKVKIWAMRAGSLVGQLFAPLAMAGGFFLAGALKSRKNRKKSKKLEKEKRKNGTSQNDPKFELSLKIKDALSSEKMFNLCAEAGLSYLAVTDKILLRLGLPGGKEPSDWNEGDQFKYTELEKGFSSQSLLLKNAYSKYGPQDQEEEVIEMDHEEVTPEKSQTDKN